MMYHHDGRDYQIAAADAAGRARDNFERMINDGPANASRAINHMLREEPIDSIVPCSKMNFYRQGPGIGLEFFGEDHYAGVLHPNARSQVIDMSKLSRPWATSMSSGEEWERDLLIHNLNTIFHHREKRQLVRRVAVDGGYEVRGVLSDRFKRMDATDIITAFIQTCEGLGAVPVEGIYTGTRIAVKMLLSTLFSPVENEILAIGAAIETSDFGNGALSIRCFALRPWCTNYAIGDDTLRKVHTGSRLKDTIEWSEKTRLLDTSVVISQIEDVVKSALSKDGTTRVCETIRAAHEEEIDPLKISEQLRKALPSKKDRKKVVDAFTSADIQNLPPGQNRWRLSNAISWIAGQEEDKEKRLDFQHAAGAVMSL